MERRGLHSLALLYECVLLVIKEYIIIPPFFTPALINYWICPTAAYQDQKRTVFLFIFPILILLTI
jgi:hypothetical protein